MKVQISATGGADKSWEKPVDVYFHRTSDGWKLVGLERMPEGNAPAAAGAAYFFETFVKPIPTPPCAAIGVSANFVEPMPTVTVRPAMMPSAAPKATSLR